jgi:hypothetical protein
MSCAEPLAEADDPGDAQLASMRAPKTATPIEKDELRISNYSFIKPDF